MDPSETFYPFNPRATRIGLFLGAVACVGLTAWALKNTLEGTEPYAGVRAGLSVLMSVAFAFAFVRLRPRNDWGIQVSRHALTIARPLRGEPISVPWQAIQSARRVGRSRDRLLVITERGPLLISRPLFPSAQVFRSVAEAVERRAPAPHFDA